MVRPKEDCELTRLGARDLAARIRSGKVTALDATRASLEAIERLDPNLHAFITVSAESALETAVELDRRAAEGHIVGPLHGVPVSIKDLISTKGIRTTRGSLLHADVVPSVDDLSVERLRAAGAVIVGKTNTPEYGFGALCKNALAGNTANPYAPGYSSGGSSGGSAVAVATGMSALSLGTDFGGSVRTPASFCNVLGFRPTAGRIPQVPKTLAWESLPSQGILARSASDAALMLSVLEGSDPRDPVSRAPGAAGSAEFPLDASTVRVAASLDLGICEIATDVGKAFEDAIGQVARVSRVTHAQPDMSGANEAFETIRAASLYFEHADTLDKNPGVLSESFRWNVERGKNLSARDYLAAERLRSEIRLRCLAFFEHFDVLATPAAAVAPFPLDQENVEAINGKPTRNIIDYLTITYAISLTGFPALSLPAGFLHGKLPFGLQLVAPPGRDSFLLRYAELLEQSAGFGHAVASM